MSRLSRRNFLKISSGAAAALALKTTLPTLAEPISLPGYETKAKSWHITGKTVPELTSFDDAMLNYMQPRGIQAGTVAVTKDQRLVLARAYTYAGKPAKAIQPQALFRIASVSKPITAVAVLQLVQQGKLNLNDKVVDILDLSPMPGQTADARLADVTVLHLLQHLGGWNRDVSGDPMFKDKQIAQAHGIPLPVKSKHIIPYVSGLPLDFTPGTGYAYSNYGYLLLGDIVTKVSGVKYKNFVKEHIFSPLGINGMKPGKSLKQKARPGEVKYKSPYKFPTVMDNSGKIVKGPYGTFRLENMLSHGGWVASAVHLAKFATAFDNPASSPLLSQSMIDTMFAVPDTGTDESGAWYGCGWSVRTAGDGLNTWHFGALDGAFSGMIRRADGLNWVFLFNAWDSNPYDIDWMMHVAADAVTTWPTHDLFSKYL